MAVAEEKGSTSGVQTFLELGWTGSHITFGSGYDLMNRSLRASALEPFQPKAESNALDYYSDIQTIDTQEELKAKIKADVEVHAPLEGAKIEVSAGYLNSVAISSKTMLQVIEEVIDQPPVRADPGTLQLSQKAKALLAEDNGLEKFRAHYGEYFVYGCRSKSSFTAVYNFEASSKEVLNEIKASVKLKSDVASAIANTNISISDNKSSVKVAISMHIKGFEDREEEKGKLVKMTEVESTFEKFQAGFKPKPYLALLCHYSAVDNRIPEPKSQFKFLGHTLGESFQRLYIMQSDLLSSPMVKAHDYATTVAQACDKLGSLDIGKSELIDAFVKEIDGCQQEVDKWFLRESLLTDAQKLTDNRLSDMKWVEGFNTENWYQGTMGLDHHPKWSPIAHEVKHDEKTFREDYKFATVREGTLELGGADRIIIGYKISNEWRADATNGWFRLHSGNVLDQHIVVDFESYRTRGCSWRLDVWTVDRLQYERATS